MSFVHGKNTFISLAGNDLSTFTNASEFGRAGDNHDVTTYGKDSHVFKRGLKNGTASMSGIYDNTAGTGPRAVIEPLWDAGDAVTLVRRTEGTGSGRPQDTVDVIITGYTETSPVADMVAWSCDMQLSDDIDTTPQS
jgi:hypothetical protein